MKMKKYFLIPLAALALAACSSDEEAQSFAPASDIVQIQPSIGAQIATRTLPAATDSATSTQFTAGDQIMVSKDGTDFYAYTFNGSAWTPVRSNHSSAYLKWDSPTDTEIDLWAYYPASASMTGFKLPLYQYEEGIDHAYNIKNADFMTFKGKATRGAGNTVSLAMQRRTARVRVTIDKFGDEFDRGAQCDLYIYSPYDSVKVTYNGNDADVSGNGNAKDIYPFNQRLRKDSTATALVVPSAAAPSPQRFIQATVYDDNNTIYPGKTLYAYGIPEHKAGYSYDYRLTVGKDSIAISSVTVSPWTEGTGVTSDGDEAEEIGYVFDGYTYHVYSAKGLLAWADAVNSVNSGNSGNIIVGTSSGRPNLVLEEDINMEGVAWTPLSMFSETIDGQGHTIKGLTIDNSSSTEAAAFINTLINGGTMGADGIVKNLTFDNVNIKSGSSSDAAVIAVNNYGTIENCVVSGSVSSSGLNVGGIAVYNRGYISGCINNANLTSNNNNGSSNSYIGGVAVQNISGGVIVACANTGTMTYSGTGSNYCRGIAVVNDSKSCVYGSWTSEKSCDDCFYFNPGSASECKVLAESSTDSYQTEIDDMNTAIAEYNNNNSNVRTKCNYKWEATSGYPTLQKTN